MTDVPKVSSIGPGTPPPKKESTDTSKFEELMRHDKVSETDPEEQKKRKHSEESKAEKDAENIAGPSKGEPTEEELLLTKINTTRTSAIFPTQVREIKTEESKEVVQEPILPSATPSTPASTEKSKTEETKGIPPPLTPTSAEKPEENKDIVQPLILPVATPSIPEVKIAEDSSLKVPETKQHSMIPNETALGQPAIPKKASLEPEAVQELPAAGPLLKEPSLSKEKREIIAPTASQGTTAQGPLLSLPPSAPIPYTQISPQMLDLFERMIGVMTVMQSTSVKETVIHLNHPKMTGSIFHGAQIIIQEHQSAPRAFNIQFVGSPTAVEAFQAKIPMMAHGFQTGGYDFKINRLEAGLTKHEQKKVSQIKKDRDEEGTP